MPDSEDDDALAKAFAARRAAVDDGRAIQAGAADALGSTGFVAAGKGLNAGADALLSGSSLADAWARAKSGYSGTADLNQKRNAEAKAAKPEAYDFGSALTAAVPMHGAESEPVPDEARLSGFSKPKSPGLLQRIFGGKAPEGSGQLSQELERGGFSAAEKEAAQKQLSTEPSDYEGEAQKRAAMKSIGANSDAVLGKSSLADAFRGKSVPEQNAILDRAHLDRNASRAAENPQLSPEHLATFEHRPHYEVTSETGSDGRLHVFARTPEGVTIGSVDFRPQPEGLLPGTVSVSPLRKNWGIAKELYQHAQKQTGQNILSIPESKANVGGTEIYTGGSQTPDGFAFRNSQGTKHLRAGPNATQRYLERLAAEKAAQQSLPVDEAPPDWSSMIDRLNDEE